MSTIPTVAAADKQQQNHQNASAPPSLDATLTQNDIEKFNKEEEGLQKKKSQEQKDFSSPLLSAAAARRASVVNTTTATTTNSSFSLPVSYITSTSIFVPEISLGHNITIPASSTILNRMVSEEAPDQSLAKMVGAMSAAGSGMMVHIFRFLPKVDDASNNNNNNNNGSNATTINNSSSLSSTFVSPATPDPPPLVALFDEEEAANRSLSGIAAGSAVAPEALEKRISSIKKYIRNLRFLPDELERFLLQSESMFDVDTKDTVRNLVMSLTSSSTSSSTVGAEQQQHLAAVAGVLVGKLPSLRIQKYEEGSSFLKVLVR